VFLFFSVHESGHFQGVAEMSTPVPEDEKVVGHGFSSKESLGFSQEFGVEWLQLCELPFEKTKHLLNDERPVPQTVDGRELPVELGKALMVLTYKETGEMAVVDSVTGEEPLNLNADMPTDLPLDANSLFSKPGQRVREEYSRSLAHAFGTSIRELKERRWEVKGHGFIFSVPRDLLHEVGGWKLLGMPLSLAKERLKNENGDPATFVPTAPGMPHVSKDCVLQPGCPLFIIDSTSNQLIGIFEQTSPVTLNLEPTAFTDGQSGASPFPVQVQFQTVLDANPIPLHDGQLRSLLWNVEGSILLNPREAQQLASFVADRSNVTNLDLEVFPASSLLVLFSLLLPSFIFHSTPSLRPIPTLPFSPVPSSLSFLPFPPLPFRIPSLPFPVLSSPCSFFPPPFHSLSLLLPYFSFFPSFSPSGCCTVPRHLPP
jgi:hypothetical protein